MAAAYYATSAPRGDEEVRYLWLRRERAMLNGDETKANKFHNAP
jgi:hypothetical protein